MFLLFIFFPPFGFNVIYDIYESINVESYLNILK